MAQLDKYLGELRNRIIADVVRLFDSANTYASKTYDKLMILKMISDKALKHEPVYPQALQCESMLLIDNGIIIADCDILNTELLAYKLVKRLAYTTIVEFNEPFILLSDLVKYAVHISRKGYIVEEIRVEGIHAGNPKWFNVDLIFKRPGHLIYRSRSGYATLRYYTSDFILELSCKSINKSSTHVSVYVSDINSDYVIDHFKDISFKLSLIAKANVNLSRLIKESEVNEEVRRILGIQHTG